MIDINKLYETNEEFPHPVRVIATDIKGKLPVIIAVETNDGTEAICRLTKDGAYAEMREPAIRECKMKHTRWVNLYRLNGTFTIVSGGTSYCTEDDAKSAADIYTPDRTYVGAFRVELEE